MSYEEFVGHETRNELAFRALDTNGDGFVSRSEFKKICPNMTKEQMDAAFAKFDKDKTGRINYTEFCSMLNKNNKWVLTYLRSSTVVAKAFIPYFSYFFVFFSCSNSSSYTVNNFTAGMRFPHILFTNEKYWIY